MAIAGLGNGSIPSTTIEALAHELRFLKCGLADMQGRLDALLVEIGAEIALETAVTEVHVAGYVEATPAADADLFSLSVNAAAPTDDVEAPAVVAELTEEAVGVATETNAVDLVEIEHTAVILEVAAIEPVQAEITEVTAPVEPIAEVLSVVDAIPTVDSSEPVAHVQVWAEAVEPAAEQDDTAAAVLPGQNVVVLAEHRETVGKRRGVVARTARWAAAIALIATVAAVAAAGTGFAGHGELLIQSVCAVAGEGCSIPLGMP